MRQQVKIHTVKGNPSNPRLIKNDKFKKLVKSIQEFPEMLKLRPTVLDDLDLGNTLQDKIDGVKRAIQIEFEPDHYEEATELINKARKEGKNVGLIVLTAFRND